MSFMFYDIIFLIAFCLFLFIFLFIRRKKLQREGILFLYRTKIGIKIIDYIGKKYGRFLTSIKILVIMIGYVLMISMFFLLIKTMQIFWTFPEFIKAVKIPPLAPLIPYLPQIFNVPEYILPPFYFTYWILILAIVAIVHEFSHGIFSKLNGIRIKSTGFGFLGPFIAAFVEPDEKKMKKIKKSNQIAILSAGSVSNIVMAAIFFFILWLFFSLTYSASGVVFNTYAYNMMNKSDINFFGNNFSLEFDGGLNLTEISANNKTYFIETNLLSSLEDEKTKQVFVYENAPAIKAGLNGVIVKINNIDIKNNKDFEKQLLTYKSGDKITITTLQNEKEYEIVLSENPENKTKPYLGISFIKSEISILSRIRSALTFFKDPNTYYAPKIAPELIIFIYNLLWWTAFINMSVALVNMLPVGIFDGGRVFYLTMAFFFKEKTSKRLYSWMTKIILLIFILLMFLWVIAFF